MADQPNLGYAKTSTTDLDTFNQWFRARPEYYAKLQEFGQDPNNVHLNDQQKQEMVRLAQSLGAVVDEGGSGQEVDDSGNFRNKSHKLKTGLIIAGIAAAALATAGAAGAFAGAAAPGAAGAGLGGVEAGATAGLGAAALPGAAATLPGLAGVGALTGVEGGAAAGLGSLALPGAGTALPAAGGGLEATMAGLGTEALPGAGTALPAAGGAADAGAFDAAGNFIGDSSIPGATGSFDAADTTGGLGSTLGKLGKGLGTLGSLAGEVGKGIGAVNTANGNNRLDQEKLGLQANAENITGQSAFEQELMARAHEDDTQRHSALKDSYRNSYASNPRVSPFDPTGAPKLSDAYRGTLANLGAQGDTKLSTASPYDTNGLPTLNPYKPINPADVQGDTNTAPGTLSKVGDWLGPGLTVAQQFAKLWGK